MILSFTGANLHVHICSNTADGFSDIYLLNSKCEQQESDCCPGKSVENNKDLACCSENHLDNKNCNDSNHFKNHENSQTCFCFDVGKDIKTDENFKFSHHTYRLDNVKIISLFTWTSDNEILLPKEQLYLLTTSYLSPPKLHSSIELLL